MTTAVSPDQRSVRRAVAGSFVGTAIEWYDFFIYGTAWLALSDGINAVPADDREGFLARLALLLGDRLDTDDFLAAVSTAASVR